MATKQLIIVTSACTLYEGQLHRSSENFSLKEFGRHADLFFRVYYDYGTEQQREAQDVMFDIWIDEPMRKNSVYLRDIQSGHAAENTKFPDLYIANPRGASQEFTVAIEYGIRVDSRHRTMDDHKHRSSDNFHIDELPDGDIQFHLYYHYGTLAQISVKDISFSIRQNRMVRHPPIIWQDITDGTVVRNPLLGKLYVADPQGATEPFTIIITMA